MSEPKRPAESRTEGRPLGGLVRHSAIYTAAPLLRQLISVGMTRFYTGWLGVAAYGIKEITDLWMIGLQQLLGQNALGAMVRFYFDHRDPDERARVITSSTIAVTILAWVFAGLALLVSGDLTPLMLGRGEEVTEAELVTILRLVLILIPLQLSTLAGLYYLQVLKRSGLYTTVQTAKLLFEVGLNFWLIGALGLGVRGFLLSMLAGEAITSLALTGWMLTTLKPRIDWSVLKPILIYALPLVPVGLCQFGLHQLDKRLLLHFAEEGVAQATTGIYGLGYKNG